MKHEVNFTIDTAALCNATDSHLAALWHVGQANPAPIDDQQAGELAETIGREIIQRFLVNTRPDLWNHQGCHFFSMMLSRRSADDRAQQASIDNGHWVTVPDTTLPDGRFVPSFQYAKYPCAKSADGKAILSPSEKPWVNIKFGEAVSASAAAGYQLSRESQELAIRHNVAQQAINWTSGVVGDGKLFQGLHKGTVKSAQSADFVSPNTDERSWHQLSNGERVYGLAGNIYTWLHDDAQGDERGLTGKIAADSPSLAAPYPSREKGMGYRPDGERDWSGRALVRGGYWSDGDLAGVFRLGNDWPGSRGDYVGFRCTKPSSGL